MALDCKCKRDHPRTQVNARSTRMQNASFLTKAFLKRLARLAMLKALRLRVVDRAEVTPAQSEGADSSGIEAQCWSDLEEYGRQGA